MGRRTAGQPVWRGIFSGKMEEVGDGYKPVPVTENSPAKNSPRIAKRIENSVMAFQASISRINDWNQIG